VADEKKLKSPEDLGRAVGEKIEALFGGLLEEPAPALKPETTAGRAQVEPAGRPVTAREPGPMRPAGAEAPAVKPGQKKVASISDLLDRVEALILNLEWEAKVETIHELEERFKDVARLFPKEGPSRGIAGMNFRVLQKFGNPDVPPHPLLVKLLQESSAALKQVYASRGKQLPAKELMTNIVSTYHQIMAPANLPPVEAVKGQEIGDYSARVNNVRAAVDSLEEVGQRLGRIVAVIRQSGQTSGEETTRKLAGIETMLGERIGRLSAACSELSRTQPAPGPATGEQRLEERKAQPDGLLLVDWSGVFMAIPSSFIAGVFPLTKQQAEQFALKTTIVLSNRPIPRLPLKRPERGQQKAAPLPSWLIHLSSGRKDYFMLADRNLGYRRVPEKANVLQDTKIKIGNADFTLLNRAVFR
jgi:hypothetical protein